MEKNIFVTTIESGKIDRLKKGLEEQGFVFSDLPYAHFVAKKKGISCALYTSLKLVVQGSQMKEFIEFFLEPEILEAFPYSQQDEDLRSRIGVDEAGKGDFFGPLSVAALFVEKSRFEELKKLKIKDCKKMTDQSVREVGKKIRERFPHALIKLGPQKYNELYSKFKNLNHMLAWCHSQAISELTVHDGIECVVIDQFANEWVIKGALKRKNIEEKIELRHKAESDIVVAGASILARAAFLEELERLSKAFDLKLPKGASNQCIEAGKAFVRKYGREKLPLVAKIHFKTTERVLEENLFE